MKAQTIKIADVLARKVATTLPEPKPADTLAVAVDLLALHLGCTRGTLLRAAAREFLAYGKALQHEVLGRHFEATSQHLAFLEE